MKDFPNNPRRDAAGQIIAATDWLGNEFKLGDRVLYCISAGRGQQMAIGIVKEMTAEIREDRSKITILGDSYMPKPANVYHGHNEYGKPCLREYYIKDVGWQPETWIVYGTYELVQVKVQRIAASGYEGIEKKAARFVNSMNITSLDALRQKAYQI